MKKDFSFLISIVAISLSLITIILFFVKVSPNSIIDSNTFIGVCAAFIGISVTLVIGFQINNTLQTREELLELKKTSESLKALFDESNKKVIMQECLMQEGFDYISAIIKFHRDGQRSSASLFYTFHHTLIFSLQTERTDYEWIFQFMREFLAGMNYACFRDIEREELIKTDIKESYEKRISAIIKEYDHRIREDELSIRNLKRFLIIKMEYDRIMKIYKKLMQKIENNPPSFILSIDEVDAIRSGQY